MTNNFSFEVKVALSLKDTPPNTEATDGSELCKNNCMKFYFRRTLWPFEDSRKNLRAMGLIEGNLEEDVCIKRTGNYSNCNFCGVTLMCTIKVYYVLFYSLSLATCFRILYPAFWTKSSKHHQRKTHSLLLEVE